MRVKGIDRLLLQGHEGLVRKLATGHALATHCQPGLKTPVAKQGPQELLHAKRREEQAPCRKNKMLHAEGQKALAEKGNEVRLVVQSQEHDPQTETSASGRRCVIPR